MGADNVDAFQRLVFQIPPLKIQVPALFVLGLLYSGIGVVAFREFTPLAPSYAYALSVGTVAFLVPFLFAAELFAWVLPDYPRKWSYFLALANQFLAFVYVLMLSGADDLPNAWSIVWLLIITVYLINILVLVLSNGITYYRRILLVSLTEPVALLLIVYGLARRTLELQTYRHAFLFSSFVVAALFLVLVLLAVNYLIRSNTDVSAFKLTSGLLQNKRERLDVGVEVEPAVQTLAIDNGNRLTLAAPWVHPGPLGAFGGGQLSGTLIEMLNREETGFFLHVPCTHQEDLADPDDAKTLFEAVARPDGVERASKLYHEDYGHVEFYGRRIGDRTVIYLHAEDIDDYHVGVFVRDVDLEACLLVDLHCHDIQEGPDKEIQYGTVEADALKEAFDDFRASLEDVPLSEYEAGFAVHRGEQDLIAIVERVDDHTTLLMGVDSNGVTADMRALRDRYHDRFDDVLLFSTDTHASVHDLANREQSNVGAMEEAVGAALADCAPATVGLTARTAAPVKLLKNDYNGLVFSVNILIRLTIMALVVLYLLLVVWLF